MFSRRDWLAKQVKQLAEFLARILKLAQEGKRPEAAALVRTAALEVLGLEASALELVDAASAVDLLGAPERVLAWARLLEALGEAEGAVARRRLQALEVVTELLHRRPGHAEAEALARQLEASLTAGPRPT